VRIGKSAVTKFATLLAAAVMIVGAWVAPAAAHMLLTNLSMALIVPEPERMVRVEIGMMGADLDRVLPATAVPSVIGSGETQQVTPAARDAAREFILSHVAIEGADGAVCAGKVDSVLPEIPDAVRVVTHWDCRAVKGDLTYRAAKALQALGSGAKEMVVVGKGSGAPQILLDSGNSSINLSKATPGLRHVIARFFLAGIVHILTGYDHIAFLLAIIMWARRPWPVVKIVSAFTLSHSVTLSLVALGIANLPSTFVEPAIAASIVYVAVENLFSKDIGRRWTLAFLFGFIHGFGFASGLSELGIPPHAVVPALASFNLGVECGQSAIVLLVMPLMFLTDKISAGIRNPKFVYACSALIATLGTFWFLDRTIL